MQPLKAYSLFLDDIRNIDDVYPTQPEMVVVRSYIAFVDYINKNGCPSFISFDNDLGLNPDGTTAKEGYDAVKWLVYENNFDLRNFKYKVHSANPVASRSIDLLLKNYIRHLTVNS